MNEHNKHYERWKALIELAEGAKKYRATLRWLAIEYRNKSLEEVEQEVILAMLEAYEHPGVQEYISDVTRLSETDCRKIWKGRHGYEQN